MSAHPTQRGMTLFEMMITIAVIAVLAMFSMPMYRQWLQNSQLRARAESIASGLQQARSEAVRLNATAGVRFVMNANDWQVLDPAGNVVQESVGADLGKNALVTATPAANSTITFGPLGQVMPAGTTVDFAVTHAEAGGADPTMKCVADGGDMRCLNVQVRGGGLVRMCDPSVTTAGDPRKCLP